MSWTTKNANDCDCGSCAESWKHRWKTILECQCVCHDNLAPTGHTGLCCEYPNGIKEDSPFTLDELSDNSEKENDIIKEAHG